MMKISEHGLKCLADWEGCELKIYKDAAGLPTIGIGHLLTKQERVGGKYADGITQDEAYDLLRKDLANFEALVNRLVRVPLTQNEYDALVIFAFNIGAAGFSLSTALIAINSGRLQDVPACMRKWCKITVDGQKVVAKGLVNRREKEIKLWNGDS